MESIIVALIGFCGSVVVALITRSGVAKSNQAAAAKTDAKIEVHQAVTDAKIDELTREVRAHNGFAQRLPVLEEQIKVANHRIADLEQEVKK